MPVKSLELKSKLKKFYNAVEQTTDGVFITDINGKIQYINPAFKKITGFTKKEALGKTPRIIKSGLHPLKYYKKLWSTILSGKNFRSTVINKKKNGQLFYADHTVTPVKNERGKITNFLGIWKDTTKQMLIEKRKDEFISIAGHELKNPVAGIKLYTQILEKHFKNKKDKKAIYFLSNLNFQIDKLTSLINGLLDLDKIKEGKLVLNKEIFDFDELVRKIIIDSQYASDKHQIIKKGEVKQKIFGDKYRIGQVLINIISNAIKYSPDKDKIIVTIENKKSNIQVGVKDFGIGIPQKEQKKIFDPYYRTKAVKESRYKGLGIGLHVASMIVKHHGGDIWVKSKPQKGSIFYFTLPLKENASTV